MVFIQVMTLMSLMLGVAGCIDENAGSGTVQDELQATTPQYSEDDNTATISETTEVGVSEEDDNALAGTCPKGQHCGSPGCSLWSDQNNNGLCDRGE
jgi:hypothetical protein